MCDTLCWFCKNATNSGCPWSEKLQPVPGWVAEESVVRQWTWDGKKNDLRAVSSYIVHECPLFVPDGKGKVLDG